MQQFRLIANTDIFRGHCFGYKKNTLTKSKAISNLMKKAKGFYPDLKILDFSGKFCKDEQIVRIQCHIHGKVNTGITYKDFMEKPLNSCCQYCNSSVEGKK